MEEVTLRPIALNRWWRKRFGQIAVSTRTGEEMIIKVPEVTWALGDPEQSTASGVTVTTRPIYYKGKRAGSIHRDYAEPLMTQLLALPPPLVATECAGNFIATSELCVDCGKTEDEHP